MKTKPIAALSRPCSSPLTSAQPANTSDGGETNENWRTDNNWDMAPTFTVGADLRLLHVVNTEQRPHGQLGNTRHASAMTFSKYESEPVPSHRNYAQNH